MADRFARLPLYLTDLHGSQRVERVQEAMSHAVYVHDISHVIVDNMQFMLGTSTAAGVGYAGMDRFTLQDSVVQIFRWVGSLAVLYCSVADPGSGAFLTPGSGMGNESESGSGMNIPDHFSESLKQFFWVKNT